MKPTLLTFLLLSALVSQSQNVGIGTTTPATNLHVVNSTGAAVIRVEPSGANGEAALELQSSATIFDFMELRKWKTGASGTIAGIPLSGLSQLTTGVGAGSGLLIGTKLAKPLYFTTNNTVRMRFDENGLGAINGNIFPGVQLYMPSTSGIGLLVENFKTTGQAEGITASFQTALGSAVTGSAHVNEEGTAGFENGAYGLLGLAGNTGIAGGFFSSAGTALRVRSTTGISLSTTGNLRFAGIGEAANKVLTTDVSGNATWQSLPSGSSAWAANGANIYNTNTGNVGVGTTTPLYNLHVFEATGGVNVTAQTNGNANFSAFNVIAGDAMSDFSVSGVGDLTSIAGIPAARLTRLYASSGALMAGTSGNNAIHFTTDGTERMRIGGDGKITINTPGISSPYNYRLQVNGGSMGAAMFLENPSVAANETVSIGRNVPASRFTRTTALHVIAAGDRAIVAEGDAFEAIEAVTNSTTTAAGVFIGAGTAKLSVELNGFIKVSGTNKTAFIHTATVANISGNITTLTYNNPTASDMVFVTPNYNPNNVAGVYNNHPIGVFWAGTAWTIFNQDGQPMPLNAAFNVMVVKQ